MKTTNSKPAAMTETDARATFDAILAGTTDPDARARREMLREYFCNPEIRAAFEGLAADVNGAR